MELFELLAKLTLDATEYENALKEAESKGGSVEDIEAHLDLDKDDFDEGIEEANSAEVDDPKEPELDLNDKPFHDALDQSQADTETWGSAIGDVFDGLKGLLATAGITVAISSIVSNLTEAVDLARSMGDNIDKSSRAMSLSTDAYQEWSHVLDINGASITDLNRGLMNMRKLMGGGEPSKEFSAAMEQLGLSAKVANGEIKSTEDLLDASLKALADFEGSAEDRDVLAQALFGRGGTKLNAMFDGTSQDIENLKKQAHELGLVMSEAAVANAAAYNDSVTNMNASIQAFKISLVEDILPVLTDIFNRVATIVAFFNPRTKNSTLSDQFKEIDKGLASNLAEIEGTSGAASDMIDKLFSMGDATKLTAEQQAEWKATAQWLIENIPSLSNVIDLDTMAIKGNKEEIQKNIKEWERLSKERALSEAKEQKYQQMLNANSEAIDKQAQARAKSNDALAKQYERIAIANDLLKKNEGLSNMFSSAFGTSEIDKNAENLEQMLEWLQSVGYEFANTEDFEKATQEYNDLSNEARKAQEEAEKFNGQLEAAQKEYDSWLQAVEELYGSVGEEAVEAESDVNAVKDAIDKLPLKRQVLLDIVVSGQNPQIPKGPVRFPKAKGDWDVPYDDYPVSLHRGERVLTASQARQMDNSYGSNVDFSGMYDIVERAIRAGMSGVSVNSFLNGKDVTDDVNRNTGRQLKARRFRG